MPFFSLPKLLDNPAVRKQLLFWSGQNLSELIDQSSTCIRR